MNNKWEVRSLGHYNNNLERFVVEDGLRKLFHAQTKALAKGTCRIIVTDYDPVKEEEDQRTLRQNRYYHKLLDIICDHTGDNHMDMHRNLKVELLGKPYVYKEREVVIVPSTKDLTTKTFGDYLEKVFKFASEEYGLILPEPTI